MHEITVFDNSLELIDIMFRGTNSIEVAGDVSDEDKDEGFGRFPLTTIKYEVKTVFYGQQAIISTDNCDDLNLELSNEFKKLIPRRLSLVDNNSIIVTDVDVG